MTFVLCDLLSSGNVSQRKDPTKKGRNIALQALFPLLSSLPTARKLLREFRGLGLLLLLFPPFRGAGEAGGVSGCTWCCVWRGSLSSRSTSVQREGWECLWAFVWGALPPLLLLREWERGELPARCRRPFPAPPISVSLPNSHRTFHDVGIRERHRSLAPACYPPVVPDLRIEDQGRIRGLGHVRVSRVDVARVSVGGV